MILSVSALAALIHFLTHQTKLGQEAESIVIKELEAHVGDLPLVLQPLAHDGLYAIEVTISPVAIVVNHPYWANEQTVIHAEPQPLPKAVATPEPASAPVEVVAAVVAVAASTEPVEAPAEAVAAAS